jgi:hypothetical protein
MQKNVIVFPMFMLYSVTIPYAIVTVNENYESHPAFRDSIEVKGITVYLESFISLNQNHFFLIFRCMDQSNLE